MGGEREDEAAATATENLIRPKGQRDGTSGRSQSFTSTTELHLQISYTARRRIGSVNNKIELEQGGRIIFHINLLRRWYPRKQQETSYANIIQDSDDIEKYRWKQDTPRSTHRDGEMPTEQTIVYFS